MGFFSDLLNGALDTIKEQGNKIQNLTSEWSGQNIDFLLKKYKRGSLTEKAVALKLLKEEHGLDSETVKILSMDI